MSNTVNLGPAWASSPAAFIHDWSCIFPHGAEILNGYYNERVNRIQFANIDLLNDFFCYSLCAGRNIYLGRNECSRLSRQFQINNLAVNDYILFVSVGVLLLPPLLVTQI